MDVDPTVSEAVYNAYHTNDLAEFHRLLSEHPEMLRHADGTDRWMWKAAIDGNLAMIKCLVGLGQNVNESKDSIDPDDPDCSFCQVEGPILQASGCGHFILVQWLLDNGALINFRINGKVRCLPLLDAATKGHLDVVELLIKHGADFLASFNGHTPLSQAISYGHLDIAEHLRSLGAK